MPLTYQLRSGDRVEILTGKEPDPRRDWLLPSAGYLASNRSREKVRGWFHKLDRARNIEAGRELLDKELRRLGLMSADLGKVLARFHADSIDDLLAFGFELGHVVEMLELAAAALVIDGADWLDTVRALGQDGLDVRTGIGLLDFVDDGQDFLARQGIGNEYGEVFIAADAFGTSAEGLDLDFV